MIEYDYKLIRDEEDEVRKYVPDKIPKELPNIVCIEGPNSSGKSTLLNILALGLHGLKLKKLDPALKNKINLLVTSDHQKLEFQFNIFDSKNNLLIKSEKDIDGGKSDIKVYEIEDGKEKIINHENFHKKYNLIYDIPQNPTQRLNELIKEIKNIQYNYGRNVYTFRRYLRDVLQKINDSMDPNIIEKMEDEIEATKGEIEKVKKIKNEKEELLDKIEKYAYSRYIREYTIKCMDTQKEIKKLENKLNNKDKNKKKTNKKLKKNIENAIEKKRELENIYTDLTEIFEATLPEEEKNHLTIWKNISFNNLLGDYSFDDDLKIEIKDMRKILKTEIKESKKGDDLKNAQMYQELINFLDNYKMEEIVIPGIEKPVNEFIMILKNKVEKNDEILKHSENLKEGVKKLDELEEIVKDIEKEIFPKIKNYKKKRSKEYSDDKYNEYEMELEYLKEDYEKFNKKFKFYEKRYLEKDLDPDDIEEVYEDIAYDEEIKDHYIQYTENNINEKIDYLREETDELEEDIEFLSKKIRYDEDEVERLKKREKHEYYDYKGYIEKLEKKTQILEKLLRQEFSGYIQKLIDDPSSLKNYKDDEKQKNYYEEVFTYLAKKVGFIRHIDAEYKLTSVNLIENKIYTEKGKEIRLSDMGTGQGQSAYLKGLLNTKDDKKIIALFDEVVMMDSKSLSPIYNKFTELYKKDKLLLGIVIQKADEVNIISKM